MDKCKQCGEKCEVITQQVDATALFPWIDTGKMITKARVLPCKNCMQYDEHGKLVDVDEYLKRKNEAV